MIRAKSFLFGAAAGLFAMSAGHAADLPLKAISERLGYDSVYFFARQFRQRVGVTPGLYRKSRHGWSAP